MAGADAVEDDAEQPQALLLTRVARETHTGEQLHEVGGVDVVAGLRSGLRGSSR